MKWCYEHFINETKPKGIVKRIVYKMWLWHGVSPSKLLKYYFNFNIQEI